VDGGSSDDIHAISDITSKDATKYEIIKGDAYLEFPADVAAVTIEGETDPKAQPVIGTRAAIQVRVDGMKGGY